MGTQVTQADSRQAAKARQLLVSSTRHSYDPDIDIDWDAPLVPGLWCVPEHRCTLYGTPLWDRMSLEQKLALSREELASSIALGVWTEQVLLQLVSRYVYDRDVSTPQVQFALTEVADEVRHMIMFANVVEAIGATVYPTPWTIRESGRVLKTMAPVAALWALLLLTEELFDRSQREMAADPNVQPVVRAMSRIHVVEEARHISFASTELQRFVPGLSPARRFALQGMLAGAVHTFYGAYLNPLMYERAGLDPRQARRAALANPGVKETLAWSGERITGEYLKLGLIGGPSEAIWRRVGFLR